MSPARIAALFFMSVLTGIMGVAVYKAFDYMVGPNIRNYAVVTACIFVGLGLSALIAKYCRIRFLSMMRISAISVLMFMSLSIYGAAAGVHMIGAGLGVWTVYGLLAVGVIIPAYALAGLSIPVAVQNGLPGRWTLLVVSLGNAAGYWIYIGTAPMVNDLLVMLILSSVIGLGAGFVSLFRKSGWDLRDKVETMTMIIAIVSLPALSLSTHLSILESRLMAIGEVVDDVAPEELDFEVIKSWNTWGWPSEVVRISRSDGESSRFEWGYPKEMLYINGFKSLTVSAERSTIYSESSASLISSLYAGKSERALVVGAGTGLSASGITPFFDSVDLVDLNADTPEMMEYFSELTSGSEENLTFLQKDAMSHVASEKTPNYDLIFSTVTGAGYSFSAMLYTEEYFELAKSKLQKGGVFGFWIDARLDMEGGASNIIKAANKVFEHVVVVGVYPESVPSKQFVPYSVVIGSDEPLRRSHENSEEIQQTLRHLFKNTKKEMPGPLEEGYPKEIDLCIDQEASPASLKKLAFARDYETELGLINYSVKARNSRMKEVFCDEKLNNLYGVEPD